VPESADPGFCWQGADPPSYRVAIREPDHAEPAALVEIDGVADGYVTAAVPSHASGACYDRAVSNWSRVTSGSSLYWRQCSRNVSAASSRSAGSPASRHASAISRISGAHRQAR
jgi:hypothetical protein